jgi:Tfp pilus assembly protein PilX
MSARRGTAHTGGFVLVIALIVLVATSLAAAHLARAVDGATAVAGNLALHAAALPAADRALETARSLLADAGALGDREHDVPARGYYASRQPGEDAHGMPRALQFPGSTQPAAPGSAPAVPPAQDAGDGMTARVLIERLCTGPGPAVAANCTLVRSPDSGGGPILDASAARGGPLYRVSVRIDGPQGAAARVQALLRDGDPPARLSWRAIDD